MFCIYNDGEFVRSTLVEALLKLDNHDNHENNKKIKTIVQMLLDAGAYPNSEEGEAPLRVAIHKKILR